MVKNGQPPFEMGDKFSIFTNSIFHTMRGGGDQFTDLGPYYFRRLKLPYDDMFDQTYKDSPHPNDDQWKNFGISQVEHDKELFGNQ